MVGETVGQYRLISELGRGRFGITFRGEHLVNGTFAVIKQLSPELTQDEQFSRRFIYESENLVRLYHSNLATILGLTSLNSNFFIISENISGNNLAEYLQRKAQLSATEASEIIIELCSALEYLHKRNYYHFHLHPGNIIIAKDGTVKLADFGLARLVGEIGVAKSTHKPDLAYPEYLAPEQRFGNLANERTDIYSIGVLLYEFISGTKFIAVQRRQDFAGQEQSQRLIPAAIQKIITKATATEPKDRYSSVSDLSADLVRFLEIGTTRQATKPETIPISTPESSSKPVNLLWWLIGILIVAVLLASPFYYISRVRETAEPASPAPREVPFQREIMSTPQPLEKIYAEETTAIKSRPKKSDLVREETSVAFDYIPSEPKIQAPSRGNEIPGGEETKDIAPSKESDSKKIETPEKGESLNIPKEDTSMMEETVSPVPSIMVVVAGGEFVMGSISGNPDEQPAHRVNISTFLIDIYEVSNAQYKAFIDANNYPTPSNWKNRMYPTGQANYPVVNVSWSDASAYAAWVGCRLPTEAEWEKAARGTDALVYPWSNRFIDNGCNYANSNYKSPVPVGIYPLGKSPFGCYDMAGNVWEWTADIYAPYSGNTSWVSGVSPNLRVVRGGAFNSTEDYLRTSKRSAQDYTTKSPAIGFRTVKSLGGLPAIAKLNANKTTEIAFILPFTLAKLTERH